ncbi:MAG: hypothetical protein H7Y03_09130 [Chitinophagaceae bacterium]|nr:hypothetical protein [Chitinophagaceae bacterium]
MKRFVFAALLLGGCSEPAKDSSTASLEKQIEMADIKIDSAKVLLDNLYKVKREDSIAYEAYEKDGIGSNHNWTHPDSTQSWIRRDSILHSKWVAVKDSLLAQQSKK